MRLKLFFPVSISIVGQRIEGSKMFILSQVVDVTDCNISTVYQSNCTDMFYIFSGLLCEFHSLRRIRVHHSSRASFLSSIQRSKRTEIGEVQYTGSSVPDQPLADRKRNGTVM